MGRTRNGMVPQYSNGHHAHRGAVPLRSAHRERKAAQKTFLMLPLYKAILAPALLLQGSHLGRVPGRGVEAEG